MILIYLYLPNKLYKIAKQKFNNNNYNNIYRFMIEDNKDEVMNYISINNIS